MLAACASAHIANLRVQPDDLHIARAELKSQAVEFGLCAHGLSFIASPIRTTNHSGGWRVP